MKFEKLDLKKFKKLDRNNQLMTIGGSNGCDTGCSDAPDKCTGDECQDSVACESFYLH